MRFFGPIVPLSAYKLLKPQIYRALEDTTNCLLKLNISSTLTTKTCLLSLIGFKLYVLTYLWIYLMLIWKSTGFNFISPNYYSCWAGIFAGLWSSYAQKLFNWSRTFVYTFKVISSQVLNNFFQPLTSWRLSVSMVWMLSNYYSC